MKEIAPTNSSSTIKVDDEDYPLLARFNWYVSDTGYAITQIRGVKHVKMHHLVWGAIDNKKLVIDHRNRDKLDNRKCNLRCVTQKENLHNTEKYENAKGYYRSGSKCHANRPWVVDYKNISNTFKTEEEARKAVDDIKNGIFVKKKDKDHFCCPICGSEKQIYGSVWTCRKCALRRAREYYQRKKAKEVYV